MNRAIQDQSIRRRTFIGGAAAGVVAALAGIPGLRSFFGMARQAAREKEEGNVKVRIHPLAIPRDKKGVDLNG